MSILLFLYIMLYLQCDNLWNSKSIRFRGTSPLNESFHYFTKSQLVETLGIVIDSLILFCFLLLSLFFSWVCPSLLMLSKLWYPEWAVQANIPPGKMFLKLFTSKWFLIIDTQAEGTNFNLGISGMSEEARRYKGFLGEQFPPLPQNKTNWFVCPNFNTLS